MTIVTKNREHFFGEIVETPNLGVSTITKRNANHNSEWKPGTIGVIINQFKRICTIKSREINPHFAWQPRFHDRIVRDENEMNRIHKYIIENPAKWERDQNNQGIWL